MVSREFCELSGKLQSIIYQSQEKRMVLERDLQRMVQSNHVDSGARESYMLSYYRQICDQEELSKQRNDLLLKEVENVSEYISRIHERTQRIRSLKMDYEAYIDECYPSWRESVLLTNQQDSAVVASVSSPAKYRSSPAKEKVPRASSLSPPATRLPEPLRQSHSPTPTAPMGIDSRKRIISKSPTHSPRAVSPTIVDFVNEAKSRPKSPLLTPPQQTGPSYKKTTQSPTQSTSKRPTSFAMPTSPRILSPTSINSDVSSDDDEIILTPQIVPDHGDGDDDDDDDTLPQTKSDKEEKPSRPVSLPSSVSPPTIKVVPSETISKVPLNTTVSGNIHLLTKDGLFRLLTFVEEEIGESAGIDQVYRASLPSKSVFQEIINCANNPTTKLAHLNSVSVSMLIIHELSNSISLAVPGIACLFTDEAIRNGLLNSTYLNNDFLTTHLNSSQMEIWKRLRSHFAHLQKRRCMSAQEIANSFAAHLIHEDSTMDEQMEVLLEGLLTNLPLNSMQSARSINTNTDESISFASVTPQVSSRDFKYPPRATTTTTAGMNPLSQSIMATAGSFQEDFLQLTTNPEHQASAESILYAQKLAEKSDSDPSTTPESTPEHKPTFPSSPEKLQRTDSEVYREFRAKQASGTVPHELSFDSDDSNKVEELLTPGTTIGNKFSTGQSGIAGTVATGGTWTTQPTDSTRGISTGKLDLLSSPMGTGSTSTALRSTQNLLLKVRDDSDWEDSEKEEPSTTNKGNVTATSDKTAPAEDDYFDFYN